MEVVDANDVSTKKPRFRVTVKKWHPVAAWKWSVREETCGICRSAFDATCPNCKIPGDDCPPCASKLLSLRVMGVHGACFSVETNLFSAVVSASAG